MLADWKDKQSETHSKTAQGQTKLTAGEHDS